MPDATAAPHGGAGSGTLARGLPATLGALAVGRWSSNIAYRMAFPLLPVLARHLEMSVATLGLLLSIRELSGLALPLAGRPLERAAPAAMRLGMAGVVAGLLLMALPMPALVVAGLMLLALTKTFFDVAAGGWMGREVAYDRRGRVTGLMELSWALSFLVGIPALAWIIDRQGVGAAMVALAGVNAVALTAVHLRLSHHSERGATDPGAEAVGGSGGLAQVDWRLVGGACAALLLLSLGLQLLVAVHGVWLESELGLSVVGLGLVALALGAAELVGAAATIAFTDRLGKRRAVRLGLVPLILSCALLPYSPSAWVALVISVVVYACFEFVIVSTLPLLTELDPNARVSTLALAIAFLTVGRAVGTLAGAVGYARWGMTVVGVAAALTLLASLGAFTRLVTEPRPA